MRRPGSPVNDPAVRTARELQGSSLQSWMAEWIGGTGLRRLLEQLNRRWTSPRTASLLIALGYLLLVGMALARHEMWRDEIEAWLLARDSGSLRELFQNLRNEGHPGLWYVLLMPLTRLSRSPEWMQALHLVIAVSAVYVVTRFSPFTRLQSLLFPLGFYMGWQYSVVSRDYAPGVLLLVTFCALYPRRHKLFPIVGLVLMLAAHTHLLVLILTIAIGIGMVVDMGILFAQKPNAFDRKRVWGIITGFGFIVIGVMTSLAQLIPDANYVGPADSAARFLRENTSVIGQVALVGVIALSLLLYRVRKHLSLVLLSGLGLVGVVAYSESSILGAIAGAPGFKVFAFIGLIAYLLLLWQLRDRPSLLILYGLGISGLLLFFLGIHSGGPHHHGLLFVMYFIAYCLERLTRAENLPASPHVPRSITADAFFTFILVCQAVFGIKALHQDLMTPYSNGKYVAQYIQAQGWQETPMVGCMDYSGQTVVGYLGIDKMYYPQGERWGSFIVWDQERYENVGFDNCLVSAQALAQKLGRDVMVVSSYATESSPHESQFQKVAEFRGAIREDENFVLYRSKAFAD
jgi:hypothetical protein